MKKEERKSKKERKGTEKRYCRQSEEETGSIRGQWKERVAKGKEKNGKAETTGKRAEQMNTKEKKEGRGGGKRDRVNE